ncbi:MlaA family lipoprotein [Desulfogranum mediterraneum]|uniref:MlaA family lipoprotein n=1 Tax=Desulfogranum mediterraneum TaxID=160661 RepID=UPI00041052AC|nr:VacJ family lipoprotein [Desulfogranum mediterraneum]
MWMESVERKQSIRTVILTTVLLLVVGFGCGRVQAEEVDFLDDAFYEEEADGPAVADPLEPLNRAIFTFNDKAYTYLLKPVATGYSKVLPSDIRGTVWNFFRNLEEPIRFVNCILQGRFEESGWVLSRFVINSVAGVFGLGDPAYREFGIPRIEASLGETLESWGVGDGFYTVIPFFGPSTLRDFSGTVVDALTLSPYYFWVDDYWTMAAIYGTKEINKLSLSLNAYDDLKEVSFDPYVAIRDGYLQVRRKLRDHSEFEVDF